jgi:hypothetical protein
LLNVIVDELELPPLNAGLFVKFTPVFGEELQV